MVVTFSIYHNKLLFKTVNCLREDGEYFEVKSQIQKSHILCMYDNMAYKTKVEKKKLYALTT